MPKRIPAEELDTIVALVAAHCDGVGMEDIRRSLGSGLSERTLQRRLYRLADEGRIITTGTGKGKRYFPPASLPSRVVVPRPSPAGREPAGRDDAERLKRAPNGEAPLATPDKPVGRGCRRGLLGQERPLVGLYLPASYVDMNRALVPLMRSRDWRVLDLSFRGGGLPARSVPHGVFIVDLWDHPSTQAFDRSGCHLVRLGMLQAPCDDVLPAVVEDFAAEARLAADHFAERRFKHMGFVLFDEMGMFKSMFDAFKARAEALGCVCHLLVYDRLSKRQRKLSASDIWRLRFHQMCRWLEQLPKPIAILARSDDSAGRICMAAEEIGLNVPDDVAVLGRGNEVWRCESAPVPLSAIETGIRQQAETAVEVMERLLHGEALPKAAVVVPPVGIVVRQSTDALAVDDPVVARALRFMWDNIERDLGSADVANAVGISRRQLERAFRKGLDSSIRAELSRRRLEQLQLLLRTSDASIADLAPRVGFRSPQYLSNQFRRATGMSPRQYRKLIQEQDGHTRH